MIAIIDYDAGNLKSVEKALISLGEETIVSRDSSEILQADKVILPGVGSFGDAMNTILDLLIQLKRLHHLIHHFLESALVYSFYLKKVKKHREQKALIFYRVKY